MWEKIKNSLPINIVLFCLTAVIVTGTVRITREAYLLRSEARAGEAKIAALMARKVALEARIAELETPEAIEREAKEKLNLKKRGETVVVVVPDDPADHDSPAPPGAWASVWGSAISFFSEMLGRAARLFGDH